MTNPWTTLASKLGTGFTVTHNDYDEPNGLACAVEGVPVFIEQRPAGLFRPSQGTRKRAVLYACSQLYRMSPHQYTTENHETRVTVDETDAATRELKMCLRKIAEGIKAKRFTA